jgi:hypothetical protein
MFARQQAGEEIDQSELFRLIMSNPTVAQPIFEAMVKSGTISLSGSGQTDDHPADKGFGEPQRRTAARRKK